MLFHAVENNAFTTLAVAATALDELIVVDDSILDDVTVPFYVDLGSEIVEVITITEATPIAGQSTWALGAALAASYGVGVPVIQRVYASQTNELQTGLYLLQTALDALFGGADGVIPSAADGGELEVSPSSGMVVSVAAGAAMVSGKLVGFDAAQLVTMTAPAVGSRTDLIQLSSAGALSIKTGSTSPDADNIGLAEIAMTDATVEILAGNITDARDLI